MQQDGPRLKKLKDVYKRAIQEILSEEGAVCAGPSVSESKDSFYGDSSTHPRPEDIRKVFSEIRQRFSEVLKDKIRSMNLDLKLNTLDKNIKDGRICYKDIRNVEYIREIFESHTVDKKEELIRSLEAALEEPTGGIQALEAEIDGLRNRIAALETENQGYESEYLSIIEEMEAACNE